MLEQLEIARPFEAIMKGFHTRVARAEKLLFYLHEIGHAVDPKGTCEAKTTKFRDQAMADIKNLLPQLTLERREYVKTARAKDQLVSPSCPDGWLCSDSPAGICEYTLPEDLLLADEDYCRYCGYLGERK